MKDMTFSTRIYMFSVYLAGGLFFSWNMLSWEIKEPIVLTILCILASIALVLKVEGATERSHYAFSFIVYGFAFANLGVPQAAIVILVSNLAEYLVKRQTWFISLFNTTCYFIVINIAGYIYYTINPSQSLATPTGILAITISMAVFTLLNHFLVGVIVWMARGENFEQSGIFDILPLIIDLTLLTLGAVLVLVWDYNPYALLLFIFPIYLIYDTMRVPALERQSEIDQKTGLFNHAYFMQHLDNELTRANRFDRPLTVIMADLDLLRNINNTYGHLAGDKVLIGIAEILTNFVRDYDVVARFGGEEYSILMPETTLSQAYERAEVIRQAVEKAEFIVPTSVTPIKATLSLGIASREDFGQTGQDIIHNADTALYRSKLKGRNKAIAYAQEAYVDHLGSRNEKPILEDENSIPAPDPKLETRAAEAREYTAGSSKTMPIPEIQESTSAEPKENEKKKAAPTRQKRVKTRVYAFIGGVFVLSLALFGGLYLVAPELYASLDTVSWLGLTGCVVLVIVTEGYSIDLYTKQYSLSTSAVPTLAGTLLFGPIASITLSLAYAISTSVKHRSSFNRYVFNFSNQLMAGMIYTTIIYSTGLSFSKSSTLIQLAFAVMSAFVVYAINTSLISIGVYLDSGQAPYQFWKQQYSWLLPIYIGMGVVASAFVFGFLHDPILGSMLMIIPLLLLRISQVQYVDRTKGMVDELQKKAQELEKYSAEITNLNDGLLETLAEVIDLRDPYVLGHSRNVTDMATKLAKSMGLHEKQVELIRRGSLLHDIGKLGVTQKILAKPGRLTPEEMEIIRKHPQVGANLLQNNPYLRSLVPIVSQHHEFYNGEGYPNKIAGNQIAIEARIVSVADAIEAMSSDRPYRKARNTEYIINELSRCSGTQFDPNVVELAVEILKRQN